MYISISRTSLDNLGIDFFFSIIWRSKYSSFSKLTIHFVYDGWSGAWEKKDGQIEDEGVWSKDMW